MLAPMARWHDLEAADESIFTTAPQIYRYPVELTVSPERVWESLTSDGSLADWPLPIRLSWMSPRPFGVGTTRQVVMPAGFMTLNERFFRWEEGSRYSFYVESATRGFLRTFAEDYLIEKTPTGSRFTWTMAIEPQPKYARLIAASGPLTKLAFSSTPRAAKKYFARNR
jgi:hypothetical protein